MKKINLNELMVCRNMADDDTLQKIARAANESFRTDINGAAAFLIDCAETHGLSGNLIRAYVIRLMRHEENVVARTAETNCGRVGESLVAAFVHDIKIIAPLMTLKPSEIIPTDILDDYAPTKKEHGEAAAFLENALLSADTPEKTAAAFIEYYARYGCGDIADFRAFGWDGDKLAGIFHFDDIRLDDLIGCEKQKSELTKNTEAFIAGREANNVLLVGSRGTGKSSAVKALANEYYEKGLRLLQLTKPQLKSLPQAMETIRKFAGKKFIVFLDDLSFEESDAEYKYLKSAIEGSAASLPKNALIYATSNRRHLVRETWRDRSGDANDIHERDGVNETISLSDRFGIVLHYYAPTQQEYLDIIRHMLKKRGITLDENELRLEGIRWEMSHSGRSGRTAGQFVAHYMGSC